MSKADQRWSDAIARAEQQNEKEREEIERILGAAVRRYHTDAEFHFRVRTTLRVLDLDERDEDHVRRVIETLVVDEWLRRVILR